MPRQIMVTISGGQESIKKVAKSVSGFPKKKCSDADFKTAAKPFDWLADVRRVQKANQKLRRNLAWTGTDQDNLQ